MSSHREAPEIAKDPVADNTDTYAFVSPDRPDTVTIIANYIPLQAPAGGPNFFEFGDDVQYRINIDTTGNGRPDLVYRFLFTTEVRNPESFLYNTGRITSLQDPNFNRPQTYRVVERRFGKQQLLGSGLASPPCNVGFRSTPNYAALANSAIYDVRAGIKVFAGQRLDGFYADLGSVFDLGALRPFQNLHLIPSAAMAGVNSLQAFNVHTIAIQVPISRLFLPGGTEPVIGVWASAFRQKGRYSDSRGTRNSGPFAQVSRLGNPLFNEVIVPMGDKDRWNKAEPRNDSQFAKYVAQPELAKLLPVLYPGVFPNLAALTADRADLLAILLTGIPPGLIAGFQNFTGPRQVDMLRLNTDISPSASPNTFGVLGGDLAGFPNGRRVFDNIVAVELRAIAGVTYPLVDPSYTPDAAAGALYDIDPDGAQPPNTVSYLDEFPYLDHPVSGYEVNPMSA